MVRAPRVKDVPNGAYEALTSLVDPIIVAEARGGPVKLIDGRKLLIGVQGHRSSEQEPFALSIIRIGNAALYRTHRLTSLITVKAYALRAERRVDDKAGRLVKGVRERRVDQRRGEPVAKVGAPAGRLARQPVRLLHSWVHRRSRGLVLGGPRSQ